MKINKNWGICIIWVILILFFFPGCSAVDSPGDDQTEYQEIYKAGTQDGDPFRVISNPLISFNERHHYSSDASAYVVWDRITNRKALMLITSKDLIGDYGNNEWPMDGIHLYSTYGENNMEDTLWYEHGIKLGSMVMPILTEDDFAAIANEKANQMFAPDIQYAEETNEIYLYMPLKDNDNKWQIAVAHANNINGIYDEFLPNTTEFFNLESKSYTNGIYDPGVFFHRYQGQNYYYMVFQDQWVHFNTARNICIAKMDTMMHGTDEDLGMIEFKGSYNNYSMLNGINMEGPDIFALPYTDASGASKTAYYLVFSTGEACSYVGYAKATPEDFHETQSSPKNCWDFRGWIFQDFKINGDHANNQASLVHFNDRNYIFYHRGPYNLNGSESRSRQVCYKEFELDKNGDIVGVEIPDNPPNKYEGCMSLDGRSPRISKGFISTRDESSGNSGLASIRIGSIKNITDKDWGSFKIYYFIYLEPGVDVELEPGIDYHMPYLKMSLERVADRLWAVVIKNYVPVPNGISIRKGQMIDFTDPSLLSFKLHFSGSNNKNTDFSQPFTDYYLWTNRMAVYDINANPLTDEPLCGEEPGIPANLTYYLTTDFKNPDGDNSYLTVSYSNVNVGIWSKILHTGWTSQEWIIDRASDYNDPKYVRLRSKWTPNYYMTCDYNLQNNSYYFLYNQAQQIGQSRQVWIMEPDSAKPGYYTFRCAWTPYGKQIYLTQNNDWKTDKGSYFNVYVQELNSGWNTQSWKRE